MRIGERIARERARQGMTQEDLSQKSGVAIGTIGSVERGRNPSAVTLAKLTAALGVAIPDVADDEENANPFDGVGELLECFLALQPVHQRLVRRLCVELQRVPHED